MSERKRSANWLIHEKMLLVDLVTDHFSIVENKKTDGVTMKQKTAEWVKISDEFNSQTIGVHRTAENLKAQWESLKKSTKKAASSTRQSFLQTGGGPADLQDNDPIHSKIMSLISTSAVGLFNKFDSDNIILPLVEETDTPAKVPDSPSIIEPKTTRPYGISMESEDIDVTPISQDWGDYTPKLLQTPISSSLRVHNSENPLDEDVIKTPKLKAKTWTSKRRPTFLESSRPSVMEEMQKKKIQAIEMQMKYAETEREEANKMFHIKYEIQKEILKQEKLKSRLLLMQIKKEKSK